MNILYATTAVVELGAGLALSCLPSSAVDLLLGTPLEAPAAIAVARVGGIASLTLGACRLARDDIHSPAARAARGGAGGSASGGGGSWSGHSENGGTASGGGDSWNAHGANGGGASGGEGS